MMWPSSQAAIPADSWPRCCKRVTARSTRGERRPTPARRRRRRRTRREDRRADRGLGSSHGCRGLEACRPRGSLLRQRLPARGAGDRRTRSGEGSGDRALEALAKRGHVERRPAPAIRRRLRPTVAEHATRPRRRARPPRRGPATTTPPGPSPKRAVRVVARGLTMRPGPARAQPARDAALGERDGEAALGDVVRAWRARRRARRRAAPPAPRDLLARSTAGSPSAQPARAASPAPSPRATARTGRRARSRAPASREAGAAGTRSRVGQLADHAHDRRRVDRPSAALVVERHVAAHDRHAERAAGVAAGPPRRASAARRCAASRGCRSSGSW